MTAGTSEELIHATSVAISGHALLLMGPSGSGKSDLAMRLIDRGATLISDDYTLLRATSAGTLLAFTAPNIRGRLELRGVGIIALPCVDDIPVALALDLAQTPERMPNAALRRRFCGIELPYMYISPFEASAPVKAEALLSSIMKG